MAHLLLVLVFGTGYWQLAPRNGAYAHEVYRSRHDKVVGGYLQAAKHGVFTAQCVGGDAHFVSTSRDARRLVEACPEP